jgi:hypothetical protein
MKMMRATLSCLAVILLISGSISYRTLASPPVQAGDQPEQKPADLLDIPEEQTTFLTPPAEEALPARPDRHTESFPVARVQVEPATADQLKTLQAMGFDCRQLGACQVETDGTGLEALKKNGFRYETLHNGIAVQFEEAISAPDAFVSRFGSDVADHVIPDWADPNCGFAWSTVKITGAPSGAVVAYVEYRARVLHTWPIDLDLYITSGQNTQELVWDNLGGPDDGGKDDDAEYDDDIYLNHRLVNSTFDGQPVNQDWYFDAYDCVAGDSGSIDYFELWIWYDDLGTARPNLTPYYIPSGWDFPVVPSSETGTHTVDDLYASFNTYIDWSVINNGNADAVGFDICLSLDSTLLDCWTKADALPIDHYLYKPDYVYVMPTVGWHTLKLEADPNNQVVESNEGDNTWSLQFYWYPTQRKTFLPFLLTKSYFEGPFELEENDKAEQANGPIRSGKDYGGFPDDANDYFSFTTTVPGDITVNLLDHTGTGVQLLLYYQSTADLKVTDITPPYSIAYSGAAGTYYVRIYAVGGYNSATPYTLRVTYP